MLVLVKNCLVWYSRIKILYNRDVKMDISKQIVDQRILGIIKENPKLFTESDEKNVSKAFLLLGVASYLDIEISEAEQYVTDGSKDGGFDAAYIVDGSDMQLNVILFQSKYTRDLTKDSNFPSNAIEKSINTINSVFDPSNKIELNARSRAVVDEIRSLILDGKIPYVTFVMLNNGLKWTEEGNGYILNAFGTQEQVKFVHFNHTDIIKYINRTNDINTQISLCGKSIQEDFNYKRVIIGKVAASEIHGLMKKYGDSLLEKNIRRYLGKNSVNTEIINTLTDENMNQNFFFYNNGITLICNKFSYNALQHDNWIVRLEGLQIINGGQTCKTIFNTIEENPDINYSNVYVLTRIYEVSDEENIVQDITYATNSQNPVDFKDLKSNDEKQVLLELGAKQLGYVYKRKRDNSSNVNTIPATVAAEAVLSVWKNKPHIARYRKNDLFDSYYNAIFADINASQMILAVLIFRYCDTMRKKISTDPNISAFRSFETHFAANIFGKILLQEKELKISNVDHRNFSVLIEYFESNKNRIFEKAEKLLSGMLQDYFRTKKLNLLDGRTLASPFRRFDLFDSYICNDIWWKENI